MLSKNLSDLSISSIWPLAEGQTIEFKQELSTSTRDEKREFVKDLAAMANTSGGVILYGVKEKKDGSGEVDSIPGIKLATGEDDFKKDISSIITGNSVPPIRTFELHLIRIEDRHVLAIKVDRSLSGPHTFTAWLKVPIRIGTQTDYAKFHEVKSMFAESLSVKQRLVDFVRERQRQLSESFPKIMGPTLLLQLLPRSILDPEFELPLSTVQSFHLLPVIGGDPARGVNIDGVYCTTDREEGFCVSNTLRNGALETAFTIQLDEKRRHFADQNVFHDIFSFFSSGAGGVKQLVGEGDWFASISYFGGRFSRFGYSLSGDAYSRVKPSFDRQEVILLSAPISLEAERSERLLILKGLFDQFYNAGGLTSCPYLNTQGELLQPQGERIILRF